MQFSQPLLLFGYVAILVPIIIHLFNFRRYRTYYFSNVKMLQDVVQKTKRESQLQHIIVLILRILCIAALVTAFAQPYIPSLSKNTKSGNLVSIYIDNSFSMEGNTPEGTQFADAIENAKQIINSFQYTDQFVLYNNDFSSKQRYRLNKEEALQELDSWEISPYSRDWKSLLAFEENTFTDAEQFNLFHYYLSDFQKNNFDFSQFSHQDGSTSYLVQKPAKEVSNVSIDSCWFLSPVFRQGQQVTLTVRVRNCGENDVMKLPMKLYVNGKQKAMSAVDIAANSFSDYQLNYTLAEGGLQCATLEINDVPITFDNKFYFTYEVSDFTNVTSIYGKNESRYVTALYGKDSVFSYSSFPADRIDYSKFAGSAVIVLDEVESISSGLADELKKYMENGGTVLVLPSATMNYASWNGFLSAVGASQYGDLVTKELKVGSVNLESRFFKGSLENRSDRLDMPTATQYFTFRGVHVDESVMVFENQAPLLFADNVGKGRIILSAVAMNDVFGNVHKHALFFIPLHNIGIRSLMQQKLYNVIGVDHSQAIANRASGAENVYSLKLQGGEAEFIPEQKNQGSETMLFFNEQMSEAGIYDVMYDGARQTAVALNYNRRESQLTYPTEKELGEFVSSQPDSSRVELISSDAKDITGNITQTLRGTPLWRYFVLISLVCLLAEILVLRFWGKWKLKKTKD